VRVRGIVGGLVAATAVLVLAAPASAHVSVNPKEAEQGSFTKLTFRVPNETDDANTTSVEVNMPEDAVIANVSVKPVPGWTANIETRTLEEPIQGDDGEVSEVVDKVTWSGGSIAPGEFQEFDVSVGPLPEDVDQIEFPSIQTYDDGEAVRWIEEPGADGAEPEHPVPTLTLVAASGDDEVATPISAAPDDSDEAAATTSESEDDSSNTLAIVALVVGGLGVILGGLALIRNRSTGASAT
jgi:periplasmic copper chaperone A